MVLSSRGYAQILYNIDSKATHLDLRADPKQDSCLLSIKSEKQAMLLST